jgi:hypothetical protein
MECHLKDLPAVLEAAAGEASPEAMQKAPPGKWNATQILEHLYLTYTATNQAIARRLDSDRPLAKAATLKQRLAVFLVTGLGYFPEGVKAPEVSVPRGVAPELVRSTIFAEIRKMSSGLDDCERRFGPRTKILSHPILGPLNVNQCRKLHWLHGRHHARQIRERTNS